MQTFLIIFFGLFFIVESFFILKKLTIIETQGAAQVERIMKVAQLINVLDTNMKKMAIRNEQLDKRISHLR